MGELASKIRSLGSGITGLTRSQGMQQITFLSKLDIQKAQGAIVVAGQKLIPTIKDMLVQSYYTSGINTHTGTLLTAVAQSIVNVQADKIICTLKAGAVYPSGKGNVYAASGALKYGAVRSPHTGAKTKLAIKAAILGGIQLRANQKRAQQLIGKVAVIAPRPGFYDLNQFQLELLQQLWVKGAYEELRRQKLAA